MALLRVDLTDPLKARPVLSDRRGHEAEPGVSRPHRGPDGPHGRGEGHQGGGGERDVADGGGQEVHGAQAAAGPHVEGSLHVWENQRRVSTPMCSLASQDLKRNFFFFFF